MVRVGAALVDLHAGVAAEQSRDRERAADFPVQREPMRGQRAVEPQPARAADGEHALVLGVDVEQQPALEVRAVQPRGAVHADLLVDREHGLERRMLQAVVREHGQRHGDGDAVVPAEARPLGPDALPVGAEPDRLARHVDLAAVGLCADHVEMALQDDGRGLLAAGRGVLPDDDVVERVLPITQAVLPGELHAEIADLLRVVAAVRHRAQIFKIRENVLRFEIR